MGLSFLFRQREKVALARVCAYARGPSFRASGRHTFQPYQEPRVSSPPILDNKYPDAPSVFEPVALLREARRQKGLATADVPQIYILDIRPA
jgi:hypothetical protein